ncbi:recombinase family protein [Lacipirellula limnantheis]|uniref:Resolvase/invertase-type recombinase catalytic domain-containing protein n=1 Tax=Lacipirellula limnantheis TaxID=2528024 RepID=A0A517U5Y0_9BACT|nr:recombinase family protein [Lacipirellula limnantheis]QDT76024.1 hypothetical protein I41_52690 [Lacipirellula limnantheis]
MAKQLRAVGYCRTSGEAQRDNTSIPNQKQSIERFAGYQNWKFLKHYVDECKSGSKIAGRTDFQKMMRDAATGKFDILVVYDITRFGRDGFDILDSARTLSRDFSVHVVATAGGYDTRSKNNILANFAAAGMSEFERVRIVERLNAGKIATAQKGIPTNGRVPWGRTFDKKTGKWGLDKAKQKTMERIAKRYLNGTPLPHLAAEFGIPYVTLHKVLMTRSGTEWTINYKNVAEGTDSPITFEVPALLPAATIKAIRKRAEANKVKAKGNPTPRFLLTGHVYCAGCGYKLTPTGSGPRNLYYYRHGMRCEARKCQLHPRPYVRAEVLDKAVVHLLFETFGNKVGAEKAIKAAMPDNERIIELQENHERWTLELAKVEKARDRVIDLVADDAITKEQAKQKLTSIDAKEARIRSELDQINEELGVRPSQETIEEVAQRAMEALNKRKLSATSRRAIIKGTLHDFDGMSWQDSRELVEMVFDPMKSEGLFSGKRPGVYVSPVEGQEDYKSKQWRFEIYGVAFDATCVTDSTSH